MRYQRTTPLAHNKPQCGCRHFVSPSRVFAKVAKSKIPDGGWTMESFLTTNGRQLTKDLLAVQRAAKLKGSRLLTKPLTKVMRAQVELVLSLFEKAVIRYAGVQAVRSIKAVTTTLQVDAHGDLWAQAINNAFKTLGKDVEVTIQPVMQSVADDIHEKTTSLLTGGKPSIPAKRVMQQQVNEIARDVTGINKTTQSRLARLISKAIDDGKSPFEVMEEVRKKIPQIATNRVPTIVRTEMGRIADRAAIRSMKDSAVVTHVSVEGCMKVEKSSPTFRGTSTCNIKNVPIEYSGDLRFHVNHTGAITASGFKKADGGRPPLTLRSGEELRSDGTAQRPTRTPRPRVVPVAPRPKPKPVATPTPPPVAAPTVAPLVADVAPVIPSKPLAPVIPDPVKVERLPGIPEGERFSRLNEFAAKFMTADDAWAVQIADEFEYPSALRVDPAKGSEYMQMARRFSDEKPTFLSRKDFIEKAKGMHPIGHFDRGVKHLNPLGELKVDKAWQGQGVYGHGYYHQLASKEKLSLADSLKGKVSGTATSYADPDRTTTARVMIGFLSKEAKVITNAQLREIRDDFTEYLFSLPQGPQGLIDFAKVVYGKESVNDLTADMIDAVKDDYAGFNKIHTAVLGLANDDGSFARLMGYDALHVEGQDFLVVVNNRHYNLLDEVAAAPKFAREGGEQYLRWRFLPPLSP